MHSPVPPRLDSRGAVFLEKLIVLLPVLALFFVGWQLAEVAGAHLVVQRASAAAGRAAMVVLSDDPKYYDDVPVHAYEGARRADVELAAGMILSAVPQLGDDFEVEVSDPPSGSGRIDVTVRASYECGLVDFLCGGTGALVLTATTAHAYHGAAYAYVLPETGVGAVPQALTRSAGGPREVGGVTQALQGKSPPASSKTNNGNNDPPTSNTSGNCGTTPPYKCGAGNAIASYQKNTGNKVDPNPKYDPKGYKPGGSTQKSGYGGETMTSISDPVVAEALKFRCQKSVTAGRNVAVIAYVCTKGNMIVQQGNVPGMSGDDDELEEDDRNSNNHSEQNVYERYKLQTADAKAQGATCRVTQLFTERSPCTDKCENWITSNPDPSLKSNVTYQHVYPPKYPDDFDPTHDPYFTSRRAACSRLARDHGTSTSKLTCQKIHSTFGKKAGVDQTDLAQCMEYRQAVADAEKRMQPRKEAEKKTRQDLKAAMNSPLCKKYKDAASGS